MIGVDGKRCEKVDCSGRCDWESPHGPDVPHLCWFHIRKEVREMMFP